MAREVAATLATDPQSTKAMTTLNSLIHQVGMSSSPIFNLRCEVYDLKVRYNKLLEKYKNIHLE
jgi:hypothetical protein